MTAKLRWPPHDKQLPRDDDIPAYFQPMATAVGDLAKVLEHLAPSVVIGSNTFQLDASGQAAEQYRAPYAALTVTSTSAFPLIISAGPKGVAAPGPGPGSAVVPSYGHISVNMKGNAWSLYGGAPGDLVTVQALARPVAPLASSGTYAVAKPVWTNAVAGAGPTLTTAGNSGVLNIAPYSTLLLQATVVGPVTGTSPTITFTINGIDALGNLYAIAATIPMTAVGIATVPAGPGTAAAPFPGMSSLSTFGSVPTPAANTLLASITPVNLGSYTVEWTVGVSGAAATTANNLHVVSPLAVPIAGPAAQPTAIGNYPQMNGQVDITSPTQAVTITNIAAETTATLQGWLTIIPVGAGGAQPAPTVLPNSAVVSWALTGTTPSFGDVVLTLLGRE